MFSTEVLGLCNDEWFLDWDNGIVSWLLLLFVHLLLNMIPLSMMSLLHIFCCYYWAGPMANDVFIPLHLSPFFTAPLCCRFETYTARFCCVLNFSSMYFPTWNSCGLIYHASLPDYLYAYLLELHAVDYLAWCLRSCSLNISSSVPAICYLDLLKDLRTI